MHKNINVGEKFRILITTKRRPRRFAYRNFPNLRFLDLGFVRFFHFKN